VNGLVCRGHGGILLTGASTLLAACAGIAVAPPVPEGYLEPALSSITAGDLMAHVKALSADEFQGRLPGTPGEERTVEYLSAQFRLLGLQPGNPDGSYVQEVPLVGIDGAPKARFMAGGTKLPMRNRNDYVAVTSRFVPEVSVADSGLVFVGYGTVAPEYGWDDYKGVDVRGKTIVMLINDPAIPDPKDPAKLDETMFKGRAMTYYGRWTYKYEIASEKGAAGAIIVHEDGPAGYPWAVVQNSWSGEQFEIVTPNRNAHRVPIQGWITRGKAQELFAAAGQDFDALKKAAARRDFTPVPIEATMSMTIRNKVREVQSRNVVARLPGSDPAVAGEHLVYMAHWDHLGKDPALKDDGIFNGALDNATGTAGLLEVAQAYTKLPKPPRRSVLFLAVTAEEQGLLGSKHYAANPLYPLAKTVAAFNMDGLNPWGPTSDMQIIGIGQNTLEDVLREVVETHGRRIVPDAESEKGYYYRSDQFELAKKGVPALYADAGNEIVGQPAEYGVRKREQYIANDYHKPSDEIKPDWDLRGAAQDMQLLVEVGVRVAQADRWPQWKEGSEFKAIREAMLAP